MKHKAGRPTVELEPYSAKRDRSVKTRSVACPVCHAAIGVACQTRTGKRTNHLPRRVIALRAERESDE